jgi:hypothetical protein
MVKRGSHAGARLAADLAELVTRDLRRLAQAIVAFPDDAALWTAAPGITNTAGNLVLHLEGNLKEYIGRQLGGVPDRRHRQREFSQTGFTREEMRGRVETLGQTIPGIIRRLTEADLSRAFPEMVFGRELSTVQFLVHLLGHFNYHLGQIDSLRRVLTQSGPVKFVEL